MGNQTSEYFEKSSGSIIWEKFDTREFYLKVSSANFSQPCEIFDEIVKNPNKSSIFVLFLQKIAEKWDRDYFVSSLLHLIKHFILYLYTTNHQNFLFIFQTPYQAPKIPIDSPICRSIPCLFTYKSSKKIIYLSIPSSSFDPILEHHKLSLEVQSNFPDLLKTASKTGKKVFFVDKNNEPVELKHIQQFYSEFYDDVLVDPFEEKTISSDLMEIHVKTAKFEPDSPFCQFVEFLIDNLAKVNIGMLTIKTQAVIEFMLIVLSSQLFRKNIEGRVKYKDFKRSPIVQILVSLNLETGKKFVFRLLEYCENFFYTKKKISYFGTFLASELDIKIDEIEVQTPRQALLLLLLISSYNAEINPYRFENLELDWQKYLKWMQNSENNTEILIIFAMFITGNPEFTSRFCELSNIESYLCPLLSELYNPIEDRMRVDLILIILLKLSENQTFTEKIFKQVKLGRLPWIKDYSVDNIFLGSVLFLVVIKKLKDNFKGNKFEHVQVYCISILFNLSQSVFNLHYAACHEFLNFIKGLYSGFCISLKNDVDLADNIKYFIQLLIGILCKALQLGLDRNTNMITLMLSEKELISKLNETEIKNENLTNLFKCLENIWKFVENEENVGEGVKMACLLQRFDAGNSEIFSIQGFKYSWDLSKWEEFMVPYVLEKVYNEFLILHIDDKQLIFNVGDTNSS